MKKKILCLFIINLFLMVLVPYVVSAESDAENNAGGGSSPSICTGKGDCKGIVIAQKRGGVRFTFIDAAGTPISDSYDFATSERYNTCIRNGSTGDKSRITGSFSAKNGCSDVPWFGDFLKTYDAQPGVIKSGWGGGSATGDCPNNTWGVTAGFMNRLTSAGLPEGQALTNVFGFINAIAASGYSIDAEALKIKLEEGCKKGEEYFLQTEPLFGWQADPAPFFGSARDFVEHYGSIPPKFQKRLKSYYYARNIAAAHFSGFTPFDPASYTLTSVDQIKSDRTGFLVGIDWVNSSAGGCVKCAYQNGKIVINDQTYPGNLVKPAGFSTLEEYLFDETKPDGANCCLTLSPYIEEITNPVIKQGYYKYCGQPCSIAQNGKYICADGKECTAAEYETSCTPTGCCSDDPIDPANPERSINNCCESSTHSYVREDELDDMFCYDEKLSVEHFFDKCMADYYLVDPNDTDLPQDYCEMYCSERITVDIPGSITAVSGRYFELERGPQGYASPYIEGFKRCRVRVHFDKWLKDYNLAVNSQVTNYNSYQKNSAYYEMYDDAIVKYSDENQSETSSISCGCSTSCSYTGTCWTTDNSTTPPTKTSYSCPKTESLSASDSGSCTIKYTKFNFNQMYNWFGVKVDPIERDNFNSYTILDNSGASGTTSHRAWSAWDFDKSDCNSKLSSMSKTVSISGSHCSSSCTLSCGRTQTTAESLAENVYGVRSSYKNAADSAKNGYNAATNLALELEKKIDKCDNYFDVSKHHSNAGTAYAGKDEKNYQLEPSYNFHYKQVYLDEYGHKSLDDTYVPMNPAFGDLPCKYEPVKITADEEIRDPRYSTDPKVAGSNSPILLKDFGVNVPLVYDKPGLGGNYGDFKRYIDTLYAADKRFTHDAKYHATCAWDEDENSVCTLVPSGAASESSDFEYTKHDRVYKVYLTTFDGTFETYHDLTGLGTDGKFDKYFREEGTTCAGNRADTGAGETFACTLHVEYETIITGKCNGVVDEVEDCDPYDEVTSLFAFRIVDPENIFPSGTVISGKKIAQNWTHPKFPKGPVVKSEIESIGAKGETYNPKYLTYSFRLNPTIMGHIKNYNVEKVDEGGYTNFDMECSGTYCSIPDDAKGADCNPSYGNACQITEEEACTKCKSNFLSDLARDTIVYDHTSHTVKTWNSPKSIDVVRSSLGW